MFLKIFQVNLIYLRRVSRYVLGVIHIILAEYENKTDITHHRLAIGCRACGMQPDGRV